MACISNLTLSISIQIKFSHIGLCVEFCTLLSHSSLNTFPVQKYQNSDNVGLHSMKNNFSVFLVHNRSFILSRCDGILIF